MTTHVRFEQLAAAAIDFDLTRAEREQLDAHLAGCPACRATAGAYRRDALAMRETAFVPAPAAVRVGGPRRGLPQRATRRRALAAGRCGGAAGCGARRRDHRGRRLECATAAGLDGAGPVAERPFDAGTDARRLAPVAGTVLARRRGRRGRDVRRIARGHRHADRRGTGRWRPHPGREHERPAARLRDRGWDRADARGRFRAGRERRLHLSPAAGHLPVRLRCVDRPVHGRRPGCSLHLAPAVL